MDISLNGRLSSATPTQTRKSSSPKSATHTPTFPTAPTKDSSAATLILRHDHHQRHYTHTHIYIYVHIYRLNTPRPMFFIISPQQPIPLISGGLFIFTATPSLFLHSFPLLLLMVVRFIDLLGIWKAQDHGSFGLRWCSWGSKWLHASRRLRRLTEGASRRVSSSAQPPRPSRFGLSISPLSPGRIAHTTACIGIGTFSVSIPPLFTVESPLTRCPFLWGLRRASRSRESLWNRRVERLSGVVVLLEIKAYTFESLKAKTFYIMWTNSGTSIQLKFNLFRLIFWGRCDVLRGIDKWVK